MSMRVIRNIAITDDGVLIDFAELPRDVRVNGLQAAHQMFLPVEVYEEQLAELNAAAERALDQGLIDFEELDPIELDELEGVEADDGPGFDNPNERSVVADMPPGRPGAPARAARGR